jgi:hypothetical protein
MYRVTATIILSSVAFAQDAPDPDIVRAAKSPYDLASYVGSHTNIDWRQLWAAMGNVGEPPKYLPLSCEDQEGCKVKVVTVPKPSQAIVVVDHLLHSYFRFVQQGASWRFAGYYSPEYILAEHKLFSLGDEPMLIINEEPRGGTGLSMELEHWFDLTQPGFEPVFTFTTKGNVDGSIIYIGRYATGRAEAKLVDGLQVIDLVSTIQFYFGGVELGEHRLTGKYTRERGKRSFGLQSAEADGKTMPVGDFALLTDIPQGRPSDEQMLPYALDGLKKVASGKDAQTREWLKQMLDRCKDTSEKRTLLELLAKP